MKSFVLATSPSASTVPFHVILSFSLHNSCNGYDISADTWVNQIIFYFTIDRFRHFASTDVFDVRLNFLDSNSLEKTGLCGMFLSIKNTRSAICWYTAIGCFPSAIYESDGYILFAIVALEGDSFDQHFNGANTKDSASETYKFID